jgi:protein-S-isoprenylcysteine O-methyltransferase Ste14
VNRLLLEAVLAFLAMPGIVAFLIPFVLLAPSGSTFDPLGLLLLVPGLIVLLWCVAEFYRSGKGTLAPWTPPKHLVNVGLYRFSRNPMYIGVVLILWGWAVAYKASGLVVFALVMMIVFYLRVVLYEEPWLAQVHGDQWNAYRAHVRRWIGWR